VEENYSLIDKAGTYGPATGTKTVEGNVTVKSPDVTLRNLIITGALIIAEEVGDGDVTLDNVTVKGKTYIRGGGKDSIYIDGGQYNEVIVEKIATKAVRIVAEDVKGLKITIAKEAAGKEIILKGDIDFVSVRADDIKVTTQADTNINEIRVQSGLDDVDIYLDEGTIVDEMVLYSAVAVQGKGKIKEASGSKVTDSTFATKPDKIATGGGGGGGGGGGTPSPSATVGSVTISGTVNQEITAQDVVITLANDTFKEIAKDADLASWITNLPTGLTAKAKEAVSAGATSVTIVVAGTPTVTKTEAIAITIPADQLNSSKALTVTTNAEAKFAITVPFVAVTDITDVPETATVGTEVNLSGAKVVPENATNKTIVWTVKDAGTTGVTGVTDGKFTPTAAGTLVLTATINDGTAVGTPFTKDFTITVSVPFVAVTDITDVPETATVGTEVNLSGAKVAPENATNKTIVWTVKDAGTTGVTGVTDGKFTPTAAGTLVLTATINDGTAVGTPFTKDFTITVSVPFVVESIAVKSQPSKLSYIEGQALDLTGLVVTLTYNDTTTEDVSFAQFGDKGLTANPDNGTSLTVAAHNGNPVVITHTATSKTANTENLTVTAKEVTAIAVKSQPSKLSYIEGQALDLTGLVVTLTYNDTTTEDVSFAQFGDKGLTANPDNGTSLTVAAHNGNPVVITHTATSKTANTENLTVTAKEVTAIAVKSQPSKLSYIEGQSLDLTGLEVTLTYNDGSNEDVALAGFEGKGITTEPTNGTNLTVAHNGQPVKVICNGKEATTENLTVTAKEVTAIAVKSQPSKLSYIEGQSLDLTGLEVTLTYNDGSNEDVALAGFEGKGITTEPTNGTNLTVAHNGNPVVITHTATSKTANTENLTVVAKKEITGYTQLEDVTLATDEHLVDLTALKASGKLPAKVTVTDGTTPADATITDWTGTYDGTQTGEHTLTAIWTMPEGYVDAVDPISVTVKVIVNEVQTSAQ